MLNKVSICGVDTSKLPVLSEKRMRELFLEIHSGSEQARQEFAQGNLRLVLSVIQRFSNRGENMDDLFQVGVIGLIKSIDNFDTSMDVRFSTYAVPMIIGEVRRYLRDNNALRVSRSLRDTAYKALQIRNRLSNEEFRDPTIDEIAREMQMDVESVAYALDAIQDPVSLFEPVFHDGADTVFVMDQLKDDKATDERLIENIALKEAVRRLNDRERKIVQKRFFEGRTQTEVAAEIGISQAQVSRLEKCALERIRKYI